MRMNTHHAQANGHRSHNKKTIASEVFDVRKLEDVAGVVRKHPLPAIAIASALGATLGLTLGSRIMRMIVGSVGAYAISDLLQRFAKQTLAEMDRDHANH